MPRDQRQIVRDIIDFARRVRSILDGLDYNQFLADESVSITVLHYLQDIGEAARGLSPATRKQTPAVDWRRLIGMRNVIVHQYWRRDYALLWLAATQSVPTLIEVMEEWLGESDAAEGMDD
jgi:uncharacterized protein with HEPN domain